LTHTLHRHGDAAALAGDWIVLAMAAKGLADESAALRLRRFLTLALEHHPINLGDMRQGSRMTLEVPQLLAGIGDRSIVHAVFTSAEDVGAFLEDLRLADLGLSVVVSGLIEETRCLCRTAGLPDRRQTVQLSAGVWGNTALLAKGKLLEVTTMCGHGLVPVALVEHVAEGVRTGTMSAEEGARRLAVPCVCGVFNPKRAAALLTALACR